MSETIVSAEEQTDGNVSIETKTEDAALETDPYAYLNRDEFSSERFKIEVKNLPKHYGYGQLRKLVNEKLNLHSCKMKVPTKNSRYAYICFRSHEDRDNAIQVLDKYSWKGSILTAIPAMPAPDPLVKKRKDDSSDRDAVKRVKVENVSVEEKIKDNTTPYWNVPYEEQLVRKQEEIKKVLKRLDKQLSNQNRNLSGWLAKQRERYDGLPCELLEIRRAENIEGYRNKCKFTVGVNQETGLKSVGFRAGTYISGETGVGPIENLVHVPKSMKIAIAAFEKFVRQSDLDVFNLEHQNGVFKEVTARSAEGQLMLIVGVDPKDLSEERLAQLKIELKTFFTEGDGKAANVTSLYYQSVGKKVFNSNDGQGYVHLHGDTHIHDTLLGLKFRISPDAFFQVNSPATEVLYNSSIELAGDIRNSTVLDICCGTGTIGLCFAKSCSQVLGLEIIPEAVNDAKQNAKENNIDNAEFFAGKAENILYSVSMHSKNEDIVAIVDPPRAGLHNTAIRSLRKMRKLNKLVYMSCNPHLAMKNFVDFGRAESKVMFGDPFVPIKAVAVDLFPYTPHCELVIFFQRYDGTVVKEEPKE